MSLNNFVDRLRVAETKALPVATIELPKSRPIQLLKFFYPSVSD